MAQRRRLEVTVAGLGTAVVGVVGHPHDLKRRHEAHALGRARRPLRLGQLIEALARDRPFGRVVAVLRDSLELEAGAVQPGRGADAAVPAGVVPGDADGDVAQRVVHDRVCASVFLPILASGLSYL